jgi:hypothetical protein
LNDGQIQNPYNPFGIVPLTNFVPRGFGFVHHSIGILYHEVPNPNLTIRDFFIAVRWGTVSSQQRSVSRVSCEQWAALSAELVERCSDGNEVWRSRLPCDRLSFTSKLERLCLLVFEGSVSTVFSLFFSLVSRV